MASKEQAPKQATEEVTKYSVEELVDAAKSAFNTQPEIMAGALYGKTEVTKEEATQLLKDFVNKPVHQAKQ